MPLPGLQPVSREFGFERGGPVDRCIERFLDAHRADVRGRVLEVAERSYTDRYGDGQVTKSDVLYAKPGLLEATVVGDLTTGEGIPRDAYDCLIVTQTLPFIYDVSGAIRGIRDAGPGRRGAGDGPGHVAGVTRRPARVGRLVAVHESGHAAAVRRRVRRQCAARRRHTATFSARAFLYGYGAPELSDEELRHHDPEYELITTVRAQRGPSRTH